MGRLFKTRGFDKWGFGFWQCFGVGFLGVLGFLGFKKNVWLIFIQFWWQKLSFLEKGQSLKDSASLSTSEWWWSWSLLQARSWIIYSLFIKSIKKWDLECDGYHITQISFKRFCVFLTNFSIGLNLPNNWYFSWRQYSIFVWRTFFKFYFIICKIMLKWSW